MPLKIYQDSFFSFDKYGASQNPRAVDHIAFIRIVSAKRPIASTYIWTYTSIVPSSCSRYTAPYINFPRIADFGKIPDTAVAGLVEPPRSRFGSRFRSNDSRRSQVNKLARA
ncbi:unnamed protein product [Phytophthora lilii]|uniref:Unnamed protein product n=1 Tax=Phytophthora lilii TaxID=2077276 RepID=A0A9W6WSR7_9STRA|nr:unnamed protein product [Phytophthora lilii]